MPAIQIKNFLSEPKKGTVFVGIINVIFSGVCVLLIERFGRKVSIPI